MRKKEPKRAPSPPKTEVVHDICFLFFFTQKSPPPALQKIEILNEKDKIDKKGTNKSIQPRKNMKFLMKN